MKKRNIYIFYIYIFYIYKIQNVVETDLSEEKN